MCILLMGLEPLEFDVAQLIDDSLCEAKPEKGLILGPAQDWGGCKAAAP